MDNHFSACQVLLVEDDPVQRLYLTHCVQSLGYTLAGEAASGEAAISLAGSSLPDIVLMDINLPGRLDGIEAAKLLHAEHGLPVIFLTFDDDLQTIQRASQDFGYGFLLKPVSPAALHSAMQMALARHDAENKLRESQRLYRDLVDVLNDGIMHLDSNAVVIYANHTLLDILAATKQDFLGTNFLSWVDPSCRRMVALQLRERQLGRRGSYETVLRKASGQTVDVRISAAPQMKDDQYQGAMSVVTDITEAVNAKKALQQAEGRYRTLFENSAVGIFRATASGRPLSANPALAEILGYDDSSEFLTIVKNIDEQVLAGSATWQGLTAHAAKGSLPDSVETQAFGRDGDELHIELSLRPAGTCAGEPCFDGVVIDITDRVEVTMAFNSTFALLKLTLDAMQDPVAVTDLDGRIILANQALASGLGLGDDPDVLKGYDYQQTMLDPSFVTPMRDCESCLLVDHPAIGRRLMDQATPFRNDHGQIIGKVHVTRDVSTLLGGN